MHPVHVNCDFDQIQLAYGHLTEIAANSGIAYVGPLPTRVTHNIHCILHFLKKHTHARAQHEGREFTFHVSRFINYQDVAKQRNSNVSSYNDKSDIIIYELVGCRTDVLQIHPLRSTPVCRAHITSLLRSRARRENGKSAGIENSMVPPRDRVRELTRAHTKADPFSRVAEQARTLED